MIGSMPVEFSLLTRVGNAEAPVMMPVKANMARKEKRMVESRLFPGFWLLIGCLSGC
jgi:hypothetical protein